jgi:hypothetical protein
VQTGRSQQNVKMWHLVLVPCVPVEFAVDLDTPALVPGVGDQPVGLVPGQKRREEVAVAITAIQLRQKQQGSGLVCTSPQAASCKGVCGSRGPAAGTHYDDGDANCW